jgi:hypothetical protein
VDSNNQKFLDELLDRSLRSYANPELPPGIEFRLLARVRSARESHSRKWRVWLWMPLPFIALLVMAAILLHAPHKQTVRTPVATVAGPPIAPEVPATSAAPRRASSQVPPRGYHRAQRLISNDRNVRKRQVFPSPAPLSEQEMALVAMTQTHSAEKIAGLAVPLEPEPALGPQQQRQY